MSISGTTEALMPYITEYVGIVENGINRRRLHLCRTKEDLVVGGLMARIATLSVCLMSSPASWNLNIGVFSLRTQLECCILLAWILKNIKENSRKYIINSILNNERNFEGRAKSFSDTENKYELKNNACFLKDKKEDEENTATQKEWLEWLKAEWEIGNIKKGDGMPSVAKRAEEAELPVQYYDLYKSLSGFSHSLWLHVYHVNTEESDDGTFRIPIIGQKNDVFSMERSAVYLSRVYRQIDENYKMKIETMLPEEYWKKHKSDIEGILGI